MDLGKFTAQATTIENESDIGTSRLHKTHNAVGRLMRGRMARIVVLSGEPADSISLFTTTCSAIRGGELRT
jgi:hypothetical protein